MISSRLLSRIGTFVVLLLLPAVTFAASVNSVLKTPDSSAVNRGDFLRATIKVLELKPQTTGAVPNVGRVPKTLVPYVRTAQQYDALATFGKQFNPSKSITRGQAIDILEAFLKADISSNVDESKILTGSEARIMLEEALSQDVVPAQKVTVPVIKTSKSNSSKVPDEDVLRAVWQLLNKSYLHKEKIDAKEAGYRAIEALVESLDDPYTVFFRPLIAEQFDKQLDSEETLAGIGAQVEFINEQLVIVAPLEKSPAERAGLKAGDIITHIDGEKMEGLSFPQAVSKVRGAKGTKVKLTIDRSGDVFTVDIVRDNITVAEISVKEQQGSIFVVRLTQFGGRTDRDFRSVMTDVAALKPKGIIFDLRNNPGGLLHAADVFLSTVLPQGSTVASIRSPDGDYQEVTSEKPIIDASVPMAVLVNKGSASASEIVAGALQDYKRAKVIGEQTFGKGSVQQIVEFIDGSSLKMTIAAWLTPEERTIEGKGITPDIKVTASTTGDRDEALLKAMELLR